MNIEYYHVDAFTSRPFAGNPAGVCILESWPEETLLQSIAAENNLAETAFAVETGEGFELRWFSPETEIDLCGHATLATAHVLFVHRNYPGAQISFQTQSGELRVSRNNELIEMDFPARPAETCAQPERIETILGCRVSATMRSRDLMVLLETEEEVGSLRPDIPALATLPDFGIIVTAPGNEIDFVSRFFAPGAGIPEDPVTGSAHCTLIPYWSSRLGKKTLRARQLSKRGGELFCEDRGPRVAIAGQAFTYSHGHLSV